jgi:hypothetical protein
MLRRPFLQRGAVGAQLEVVSRTVRGAQRGAVDRCDPIRAARVASSDRVPETHTWYERHC